jgi:hypothetical protein
MKIKILIIGCSVIFFCSQAFCSEIFGNYTTNPEITPGIRNDGSELRKKIIKRSIWKLSITAETVSMQSGSGMEPVIMPYQRFGKFILCEAKDDTKTIYLPLYINEDETIHSFMNIFFKDKK